MKKTRRKFTSEFKSKVAVEALKERQTLSELAERFELHPNQISSWKREFLENSELVFAGKTAKNGKSKDKTDKLYQKIGQLEVENDFLKKTWGRKIYEGAQIQIYPPLSFATLEYKQAQSGLGS